VEKAPEAFRTISEVADDLDIPQHVLRFWESRFAQIKPMKRGGGRRYYRPDDVALLRGVRHLLYGQGYTIRGVQRILREQGIRFVQTVWQEGAEQPQSSEEDDVTADVDDVASEVEGAPELVTAERTPVRAPPVSQGREPTFAPQADAGPRATAPRGLSATQRQALKAALDDLAECRRLLAASADDGA